MPDYLRGGVRDQVNFVRVNPIFLYGWKGPDLSARVGITTAELKTQLGHLDITAALAVAGRILVTGANSPKPARVTKKDATAPVTAPGSSSSFVGYNSMGTAIAGGWTPSGRSRGVSLTANTVGKRSVTAIAVLSNGLHYAFPLNKADFDRVKVALGLKAAGEITTDTERRSLVTGSRSKPGKAQAQAGGGIFTTFYSTGSAANLAAAGYSIISDEFVEFPAAAAPPA